MALDGIYLYSLSQNLKNSILNSKIDKINQPEKDELILTLRKDRKNSKLLISASSKYPRIHLTEVLKNNPIQAPMFTMVLRKCLIGGKIFDIKQLDGDRILNLYIESTDELGFNSIYILIIEIMGRHSNITLVRERDNKIMDCIKHIGSDVNTYRTLHPGLTYKFPPKSTKLNPFDYNLEELNSFINNYDFVFDELTFTKIFTGISKPISIDLFNSYNLLYDKFELENIKLLLKNYILNLNNNLFTLYLNNDNTYLDIYPKKLSQLNNLNSKEYENPHIMMDEYYYKKDKQERLKSRAVNIQKLISTNIDRCEKKDKKLNLTLKQCELKEVYKIKGDLLTSYIYSIKKGMNTINLLNFYSEKEEYLDIELDVNKSPSENVQTYYKKYNKLKKSEISALEQISINDEELQYLQSVLINIQNCENYNEIEEIKNELISSGYIRKRNLKKTANSKNTKSAKPLHFISSDGIDIYVGKNNIQNDYLSLKFANKNHMWLHTKNIPGSHVIICSTNIPDNTLVEAGTIAAYYSKAKSSTKVPVDYTLVKNLKKPSNAKPGMVIYNTNYSLYAEPTNFENLKIEKL